MVRPIRHQPDHRGRPRHGSERTNPVVRPPGQETLRTSVRESSVTRRMKDCVQSGKGSRILAVPPRDSPPGRMARLSRDFRGSSRSTSMVPGFPYPNLVRRMREHGKPIDPAPPADRGPRSGSSPILSVGPPYPNRPFHPIRSDLNRVRQDCLTYVFGPTRVRRERKARPTSSGADGEPPDPRGTVAGAHVPHVSTCDPRVEHMGHVEHGRPGEVGAHTPHFVTCRARGEYGGVWEDHRLGTAGRPGSGDRIGSPRTRLGTRGLSRPR